MSWDDDERLLAELGAAVRAGREVPATFVEAGKAAFAWRTVDTELAELAHDSGGAIAAGTRGRTVRSLTFTTEHLTVEAELTPDGLAGQLVPPGPGEVELCLPGGVAATAVADDVGWFVLRPVPDGLFRLHVRTASVSLHTPWTRA
jgi:hypothetical protein